MRCIDADIAIAEVHMDEYGVSWTAEKIIDFLKAQPTVEAIPVEEHENKVRDLEWTIEWLIDDIVMLQEEVLE